MRIEQSESSLTVVLSERNLRSLLAKLEIEGSHRTIFTGADGPYPTLVFVSAEEDSEHYDDRAPGRMHPDTERVL